MSIFQVIYCYDLWNTKCWIIRHFSFEISRYSNRVYSGQCLKHCCVSFLPTYPQKYFNTALGYSSDYYQMKKSYNNIFIITKISSSSQATCSQCCVPELIGTLFNCNKIYDEHSPISVHFLIINNS